MGCCYGVLVFIEIEERKKIDMFNYLWKVELLVQAEQKKKEKKK